MTISQDDNATGKDFNRSTPELEERFKVLPSTADCKEYLKLRMMQLTEVASVLLCVDQGNIKLMEFLHKQIPVTYKLITEDTPQVASSEATEGLGTSFSYEDTNYKAIAVDANGLPLLSADDSQASLEELGL